MGPAVVRARRRRQLVAVTLGLSMVPGPAVPEARAQAGPLPNPVAGKSLWVERDSDARRQAETWKRTRPQDAALMERLAEQPVAKWWGDWARDIQREVSSAVAKITASGSLPVFVAYNIPGRDCGQYSKGGAGGAAAYRRWIGDFARGLAGRSALVILEPDALAQLDCLPAAAQQERVGLIREAVGQLKRQRAHVYIDAGHPNWKSAPVMAERLRAAGVDAADGFALNVSNHISTERNIAYGEQVSKLLGGKHFIVDTSRSGHPGDGDRGWCNPRGVAIGRTPTTNTGHPLVDAYLWIKVPGESDGECGGGPAAGKWWAEYALELSRAASTLARTLGGS